MKYHLASHNGKSFDGKAQDVFVSVPWYPSRDPETWIFDPTGEEEELVLSREQLKSMLLYLMQNDFVQSGVDGQRTVSLTESRREPMLHRKKRTCIS